MTVVYVVLAAIAVIAVLYIFLFVRPRANAPESAALLCDYAHRGLHSVTVPENSLAAFKRAVDGGYGIELDVQLSADGTVVVFHDYTLLRMTGVDKKVADTDISELKSMRLADTDERIPTFSEVLALVDGKVPLLVELKGESLDSALCPKVAELLKDYHGDYCIESFNPLLIKSMKKHLPQAYYGQLYTNVCRDKKKYSVLNILLTGMCFNFIARPDFIAFNKKDRPSLAVRLATKKAPKFVWTIKNDEELKIAHKNGEYAIFERDYNE